ncbi:Single-strand selective monofunctional uracil DNA glycosylase [Eumeta japonica]|uniref:Single-strand selective monofunctional uracil DNA glycosylase n=1 Tax=Eumeta variegata TaxID=151549 RepID=A0A4C1Z066_EUMVA|nr:Single-strand selective monofunctional uracil DNA glycosylase [Eumeta japonica]
MPKRKANSAYDDNTDNKKVTKKETDIASEFIRIANRMNSQLGDINFIKKIDYVYNPTRYASLSYEQYVQKFCNTTKKVMFLGMNPGPWGMSQTGVPFGEVDTVKNWMHIEETVFKPEKELSVRPVLGFACGRSEVSGKRFWGLMKELCGEAESFFTNCFVYNYIPLQFMNARGKNLPPTTFKGSVGQSNSVTNELTSIAFTVPQLRRFKIGTVSDIGIDSGIKARPDSGTRIDIDNHTVLGCGNARSADMKDGEINSVYTRVKPRAHWNNKKKSYHC